MSDSIPTNNGTEDAPDLKSAPSEEATDRDTPIAESSNVGPSSPRTGADGSSPAEGDSAMERPSEGKSLGGVSSSDEAMNADPDLGSVPGQAGRTPVEHIPPDAPVRPPRLPRPGISRAITSVAALAMAATVAVLATYVVMHWEVKRAIQSSLLQPAPSPVAKSTAAPTPGSASNSPASSAAIEGPRVALVIGNGDYRYVPRLANPRNDARLIASQLRHLGFTLVGGDAQLDLDQPALERALEEFSRQLQGSSVALFYYAGHGLALSGENYLVPTTANPERESDVKLQMVDAQVILDQMQDAGARLNIVILDACRNNPFGGRGLRAVTGGLAPMQAPQGTLIAYATQPGAVASDGKGPDSPYSTALSQELAEPGIEFRDAFNQVGLKVTKVTGGVQQPWTANSPIDGHFYFAGAPAAAPSAEATIAASPPPGEDAEIVFWQSVENSKQAQDFEAYLQQYPTGKFSALARARLAELSSASPSATITAPAAGEVATNNNAKLLPASQTSPTAGPHRGNGSRHRQQIASIETPAPPRPMPNRALSRNLSDYLHHNRLPYVEALVLSDQTGEPTKLILSGRVRTDMGKRDAESKARDYLDAPDITIRNGIILDQQLASKTSANPSAEEVPGTVTNRRLSDNSCLNQCEQIYNNCSSACQTQDTGSSIAAIGGAVGSLIAGNSAGVTAVVPTVLQGDYQVCANACETHKNTCTQLCGLKSSQQ
jgi:hypothetical protein